MGIHNTNTTARPEELQDPSITIPALCDEIEEMLEITCFEKSGLEEFTPLQRKMYKMIEQAAGQLSHECARTSSVLEYREMELVPIRIKTVAGMAHHAPGVHCPHAIQAICVDVLEEIRESVALDSPAAGKPDGQPERVATEELTLLLAMRPRVDALEALWERIAGVTDDHAIDAADKTLYMLMGEHAKAISDYSFSEVNVSSYADLDAQQAALKIVALADALQALPPGKYDRLSIEHLFQDNIGILANVIGDGRG